MNLLGFRVVGLVHLVLVLNAAVVVSETFTVDRFDDANGSCTPGDCSLREALLAANATPESDSVVLPEGTHILSIPEAFPGDPTTGGLEILFFDVEIVAPDGAIVDAQGIDRVFRFFQSNSRLENLTITGGYEPDGIGGGVYGEQSDLELSNLWITGNLARAGGGLGIEIGTVTLADSTVSDNTAGESGGGAYVFGISSSVLGRLEIGNSTVSGNQAQFAGGAIMRASAGELLLEHSTITDNTNRPGDPTIFAFLFATRANAVQTLIEGTCTAGPETSCIYQTSRTDELPVLDLGLAPLAANGGSTPTHRLLPTSPAIDLVALGAACPSADQRGFVRPEDGDGDGVATCDAGSYELAASAAVAVPILSSVGKLFLVSLLALIGLVVLRR